MKQIGRKHLAFLWISLFVVFFWYVHAVDTTSDTFSTQSSSWLWSSSSVISTEFYPRPSWSGAYYINKWNNSSIIWNYFEWYYYDSILWYFQFDWSANQNENVRIIWSTNVCPNSYWYKLWGFSYSPSFWFMNFNYNNSTFVYYCEDEWFLRWYAYNDFLWFQNFEWISFDINAQSNVITDLPDENEDFINTWTNINDAPVSWDDGNSSTQTNSNFKPNTIQNDTFQFDVKLESLFYIIK